MWHYAIDPSYVMFRNVILHNLPLLAMFVCLFGMGISHCACSMFDMPVPLKVHDCHVQTLRLQIKALLKSDCFIGIDEDYGKFKFKNNVRHPINGTFSFPSIAAVLENRTKNDSYVTCSELKNLHSNVTMQTSENNKTNVTTLRHVESLCASLCLRNF